MEKENNFPFSRMNIYFFPLLYDWEIWDGWEGELKKLKFLLFIGRVSFTFFFVECERYLVVHMAKS